MIIYTPKFSRAARSNLVADCIKTKSLLFLIKFSRRQIFNRIAGNRSPFHGSCKGPRRWRQRATAPGTSCQKSVRKTILVALLWCGRQASAKQMASRSKIPWLACSGVAGTISKTKLKSGGHGFRLHGLPFALGVISAEWSASLTLHLRLGVGLIDRRYRISHSVEGPKLVPLPCEGPFPFPLICANIAAGCLCCFFRAEVPFKSFGWIMFEARSGFQWQWNNVERDMHAARGLSILTPMSQSKNMRHSKSQALLASGWSRLDGKFSWRQSKWRTTLRVLAVHNKMPNGDSMFALWRRLAISLTLSIGLLTSSSAIWAL